MILIVASRVDDDARRLSRELPEESIQLLTPLDLSRPGWRVIYGRTSESVVIAGDRKLESRGISGVLCLLPRILEQELVHIEPGDRAYVAAEMTAFLIFWLSSLQCPKLNAPTAGCMSGPLWSPERWLVEAAAAGLPVRPLRRSTRASAESDPGREGCITITLAGRSCLGYKSQRLSEQARLLAAAAHVGLLGVHFVRHNARYCFNGADPFPDVSQPGAAEAIWDFFHQRGSS